MRVTKPVEERRQEIVDTARALFIADGFANTTIADISTEIRIAQGLVYHYFDSKTDILYAVVDQLISEQVANTRDKIQSFEGLAIDSVRELLAQEMHHKTLGKLLPSLMADKGIMEYAQKKVTVQLAPVLEWLIARGNEDGSWNCPYPKETAIVILQGVGGLIDYETIEDHMEDVLAKQDITSSIITRLLGIT